MSAAPAEVFRVAVDTYHQAANGVREEAARLLGEPDPQRHCYPRRDLYVNTVGLTEAQRLEWLVDGARWHQFDSGWEDVSVGAPAFVECMSCHAVFAPLTDEDCTGPIQAARAAGASWTQIGAALNMTKQGAWSRFHTDTDPRPPAAAP